MGSCASKGIVHTSDSKDNAEARPDAPSSAAACATPPTPCSNASRSSHDCEVAVSLPLSNVKAPKWLPGRQRRASAPPTVTMRAVCSDSDLLALDSKSNGCCRGVQLVAPDSDLHDTGAASRRNSCCLATFSSLTAPQTAVVAEQATAVCCELLQVPAAVIFHWADASVSPSPQQPTQQQQQQRSSTATILALSGRLWNACQLAPLGAPLLRAVEACSGGADGGASSGAVFVARDAELAGALPGGAEARFLAAAPISDIDGTCMGAIAILDTNPRTASEDQLALLLQLAALVARDLGRSAPSFPPPSHLLRRSLTHPQAAIHEDRSLQDSTVSIQALLAGAKDPAAESSAATATATHVLRGAPIRLPPRSSAVDVKPNVGVALVDAAAPGGRVLLANDLFGIFMGVPMARARAAPLVQLLVLSPEDLVQCAAAARAGAGFQLASCLACGSGGSMHLKLRLAPLLGARSSGSGGSEGAEGAGAVVACYLCVVDFLSGSDVEMWQPNGMPRTFRLL